MSAAIWAATYLPSVYVLKHNPTMAKPAAIAIAIVPIVLFVVFIYFYIKGIAALDEVKQRIQFEAVVIGFSLGLLLLMVLFMLDLANLLDYEYFGYPHLVLYFIAFYYIGYRIAQKKYAA
jgi:xanthine/uracil permease